MDGSTLQVLMDRIRKADIHAEDLRLKAAAVKILDNYVKQIGKGPGAGLDAFFALREGGAGKIDVHHLDKLTQYLMYHAFVTKLDISGYMKGILDVLGALVKHYKPDKQMKTKIQKDIVMGIEIFTVERVEEGCKTDYWDRIAMIVGGLCQNGNGFELHMFKRLFLYADEQGSKNEDAYDLAMYALHFLKQYEYWDIQSLPGLLHEYCPNLMRDKAKLNGFIKELGGRLDFCGLADVMQQYTPDGDSRRYQASCWKEKGNKHHRNKEYHKAIETYTKGIDCKPPCHPLLLAALHCNRAASKVMINNYASALDDCTAALEIDEFYERAYIRGFECLLALQKPGQALQWLNKYDIDIGAEKGKLVAKAKADLVAMVEKESKGK